MSAEIVDHVSGEVVETITEVEARRLTTEAKNEFRSASDHFGKAWSLIEEAVKGGGHLALGYRSPGDYLHAEFDGVLSGLDVAQRRVAVRSMSSWGLSTRAIAKPLGVTHPTVLNDQQSGGKPLPPEPEPKTTSGFVPGWRSATEVLDAAKQIDGSTPAATAAATGMDRAELDDLGGFEPEPARPGPGAHLPEPAPKVTGIDGKQYSRSEPKPEPSAPRRRPLGDGFRDASLDLGKVITRIENLIGDDRFTRNKNEVARYANDLIRARDALQRAIDQMS